jgi:hypothetical protein
MDSTTFVSPTNWATKGRAVVSLTTNDFGGAQWDGRDGGGRLLESGLYFVLLRSDGRTKKIRLVLQR